LRCENEGALVCTRLRQHDTAIHPLLLEWKFVPSLNVGSKGLLLAVSEERHGETAGALDAYIPSRRVTGQCRSEHQRRTIMDGSCDLQNMTPLAV
jgi:hypothetical protein